MTNDSIMSSLVSIGSQSSVRPALGGVPDDLEDAEIDDPSSAGPEMDDWQLLEAWCGGRSSCGEALVSRYLSALTRFFRSKLNNPEDVAELISETWLACTRSKERVRDRTVFKSFLLACAVNVLRQFYRKQAKRKREVGDYWGVYGEGANDVRSLTSFVSVQRRSRLLATALEQVPLEQQIVLELYFIEGLGGSQIAALLDVPRPTVYTRLRRGKERLRAEMDALAEVDDEADSSANLRDWAKNVRDHLTVRVGPRRPPHRRP